MAQFLQVVIFLFYLTAPIAIGIILKKAGFRPWWAVLALIPGVSMVWLWVFAFSQWPATRT